MHRPLITAVVVAVAGGLPVAASAQPDRPVSRQTTHERNGRIAFQANVGRFRKSSPSNPTAGACGRSPTWEAAIPAPRTRAGRLTAPPSLSTPRPVTASTSSLCRQGRPLCCCRLASARSTATPPIRATAPRSPLTRTPDRPLHVYTASSSRTPTAPTLDESPPGIRTTKAYDTESQWSPDGKRLAFTRVKNDKQAAVFVVNVDGTGSGACTPWSLDAASPDWSPDGREILFNTYYDNHPGKFANICSIRPHGGHRTLLTHTHTGVQSFRPAWSPDGTRIAFTRFTPTGKRSGRIDLFTMSADGRHLRRITNMPRAVPTNADWGTAP